jgi:hypothetical protein
MRQRALAGPGGCGGAGAFALTIRMFPLLSLAVITLVAVGACGTETVVVPNEVRALTRRWWCRAAGPG